MLKLMPIKFCPPNGNFVQKNPQDNDYIEHIENVSVSFCTVDKALSFLFVLFLHGARNKKLFFLATVKKKVYIYRLFG